MRVDDWKTIGELFARLVSHEPPHIQIAIGLAVAFSLLMFVEGLRASFVPRKRETAQQRLGERPLQATGSIVRGALKRSNPKRSAAPVKPHRAPRPRIRRVPSQPSPVLPQVSSFEE